MVGFSWVAIAALLWGAMGTGAKALFQAGVTPQELVSIRTFLVALFLLPVLFFLRKGFRPSFRDCGLFLIFGLTVALNYFAYFFAISRIQVSTAILLQYLAPSIVALFGILLGRIPKGFEWSAILLALTGCYLVTGAGSGGGIDALGVIAGLVSACAYAIFSMASENLMKRHLLWQVHGIGFIIAGLACSAVWPVGDFIQRDPSSMVWFGVFAVAIFGTLIPFALFLKGITSIGALKAAVVATLEPIFAAFLAWFFLGEALTFFQGVGVALVILSVLLLRNPEWFLSKLAGQRHQVGMRGIGR